MAQHGWCVCVRTREDKIELLRLIVCPHKPHVQGDRCAFYNLAIDGIAAFTTPRFNILV